MSGRLWSSLFQTWNDAEHYQTLQFDCSLNDLNVHSRSQGGRKAKTCAVIQLWSCMKQLGALVGCLSRVPDQNGVPQAWYIVELHHSGREPSLCKGDDGRFLVSMAHMGRLSLCRFCLANVSITWDEAWCAVVTCVFICARVRFKIVGTILDGQS